MTEKLMAKASVTIDASRRAVWTALTDPDQIREYMFGADVESGWTVGSPITWKGEMKGKHYEDKGKILRIDRNRLLQYSHFSPLSGSPDQPENYHTVTITLSDDGGKTKVTLEQDRNADEAARKHSQDNWKAMLDGLKRVAEA